MSRQRIEKRLKTRKLNKLLNSNRRFERLRAEVAEVDHLRLELASKTQEGLVLSKEKFKNLEKEMGEKITSKENEFSKMVNTLKDDATQSYIVGFETAL